jgi:hypothetical protein
MGISCLCLRHPGTSFTLSSQPGVYGELTQSLYGSLISRILLVKVWPNLPFHCSPKQVPDQFLFPSTSASFITIPLGVEFCQFVPNQVCFLLQQLLLSTASPALVAPLPPVSWGRWNIQVRMPWTPLFSPAAQDFGMNRCLFLLFTCSHLPEM